MSNPSREYDKTHLSIDTAEERVLIHRDYIAHCLRWSHVVKKLYEKQKYKTARILDVGCGKEAPLAKLLYSNRMSGAKYFGIDMNKLQLPEMLVAATESGKLEVTLQGQTDASELLPEELPWVPTVITCFEVYEHVHPRIARRLVENLRRLIHEESGVLFFSTPCWNGSAAANHINETTYDAMGRLLMDCGWDVREHYGTFASQSDYVGHLTPEQTALYTELSTYYDSNLLAVMLAPLYPQYSRNVLWVCTPSLFTDKRYLRRSPEPWSQHPDWRELDGSV